jgi:hypothetical protein
MKLLLPLFSVIFATVAYAGSLVPMGMDSATGQPRIAQPNDTVIQSAGFNTSGNGAPGTMIFVSGTAQQVSATIDADIVVPITYNPSIALTATCKVEISSNGSS